jgi:hypothetical protein
MAQPYRLTIVSDIHYASAAEQARGDDYEIACIPNPALRLAVRFYRRFIWLRRPLRQNYLLERFLDRCGPCDYLIANGDYACDTDYVGVSDDAAHQSAQECVSKLRARFGSRLRLVYGDHELGKMSFVGERGGMRLASWTRARQELGLEPFWQLSLGNYLLLGVVSSLIALPLFEPDTLAAERPEWTRLRAEHLGRITEAFATLKPSQRVLLFCHDPSALPFLAAEPQIRARLEQIEQTLIGHLHSNLILWKSRWLAGMPRIHFLGHTARRLSRALRQARDWRPFKVRLCPSLSGIELLKDGGYLSAELDPEMRQPARFYSHRLPR